MGASKQVCAHQASQQRQQRRRNQYLQRRRDAAEGCLPALAQLTSSSASGSPVTACMVISPLLRVRAGPDLPTCLQLRAVSSV